MARVFLNPGEQFTVNDNNVSVFGASGAGTEAVMIGSGIQGLTVDQNVESVQFPSQSYNYQYLQTGNQLKVYGSNNVTLLLVATIPVQGDSDGSLLIYPDAKANAKLLPSSIMTWNGMTISSTVPSYLNLVSDSVTTSFSPPTFSITAGSAELGDIADSDGVVRIIGAVVSIPDAGAI